MDSVIAKFHSEIGLAGHLSRGPTDDWMTPGLQLLFKLCDVLGFRGQGSFQIRDLLHQHQHYYYNNIALLTVRDAGVPALAGEF